MDAVERRLREGRRPRTRLGDGRREHPLRTRRTLRRRDVESALVPHTTARSLLVALQTSPAGPHSLKMPTTDDHYDRPDKHPFELIPWIEMAELHYGMDERDERGGGIRFPPAGPGKDIITRFSLTTDEDHRVWFHGGVPVFRSTVWSNMSPQHA